MLLTTKVGEVSSGPLPGGQTTNARIEHASGVEYSGHAGYILEHVGLQVGGAY